MHCSYRRGKGSNRQYQRYPDLVRAAFPKARRLWEGCLLLDYQWPSLEGQIHYVTAEAAGIAPSDITWELPPLD
jgi:hypothetical protein